MAEGDGLLANTELEEVEEPPEQVPEEAGGSSSDEADSVQRHTPLLDLERLALRQRQEREEVDDILCSPKAKARIPPRPTPKEELEHRIADTFLIARLALQLYTYLFLGVTWWVNFWRLVGFAVILLPGFSQMIAFYYLSPRLLRSIPYSEKPRNRLDIFLPRKRWRAHGPRPVVIFITGGAWTIGYKAWGALLGRRLSQRGVLVFALDYRNFPQGNAKDMLEDTNTGIAWVLRHASAFGGDDRRVYLVGQSAGGQLGLLALLAQVQQAMTRRPVLGASPAWDPGRIRAFCGVSGAYNLSALADHMDARGLYRPLFEAIHSLEGRPMLRELSPTHFVRRMPAPAAAACPSLLILHGTADKSVPMDIAVEFVAAAQEAGVGSKLKLYKGKTHTQPIVEDPMRGGRDELMDDVLSLVSGRPERHRQFPMLPSLVIDLATAVCPF